MFCIVFIILNTFGGVGALFTLIISSTVAPVPDKEEMEEEEREEDGGAGIVASAALVGSTMLLEVARWDKESRLRKHNITARALGVRKSIFI